jgi:hypothetical protein
MESGCGITSTAECLIALMTLSNSIAQPSTTSMASADQRLRIGEPLNC